jgi:hypothetical protein
MNFPRHPGIDPIRLPLNQDWLKWAIAAVGEDSLVKVIKRQIARRSSGIKDYQTKLLNRLGVRGSWQEAKKMDGEIFRITDREKLLRVLVALQPDIVIDSTPMPWRNWRGGSQVVVVVGQRRAEMPKISEVKQLVIGARDSEAVAEIGRLFYGRWGPDCNLVLQHIPRATTPTDAQKELESLCNEPSVAAVVVVGSEITNRMAIPMARKILQKDDPPWKFRWRYKPSDWFLADKPLCKPAWDASEEGIVEVKHPTNFVGRDADDKIRASKNRRNYGDCGLLMIDARRRPLLISAQGHGGCGTLGCIQVLSDSLEIEDRFKDPLLGPDRIFEAVKVHRRVQRPYDFDNATIVRAGIVRRTAP